MAGAHQSIINRHAAIRQLPLTFQKPIPLSYFTGMKKPYLLYYIAAALFVIAAVLSFINGGVPRGSIALVLALGMVLAGYRSQKRNKILD